MLCYDGENENPLGLRYASLTIFSRCLNSWPNLLSVLGSFLTFPSFLWILFFNFPDLFLGQSSVNKFYRQNWIQSQMSHGINSIFKLFQQILRQSIIGCRIQIFFRSLFTCVFRGYRIACGSRCFFSHSLFFLDEAPWKTPKFLRSRLLFGKKSNRRWDAHWVLEKETCKTEKNNEKDIKGQFVSLCNDDKSVF